MYQFLRNNVFCLVNYVPFVTRLKQKKDIRPTVNSIKSIEGASCVNQSSFLQPYCSMVPNMPWLWDLVAFSGQIPLCLSELLTLFTQNFIQIPHKTLTNLNLHAWLQETQLSKSRAFLRQW